jgi:hypothetical protein
MSAHINISRPSTPDLSRSPSPGYDGTLYFGYGSNLWKYQVEHRCPSAKFVGVARLRHWRWQINECGYTNVVEAPPAPYSPATVHWLGPLMGTDDFRDDNDRTYGMVFQLDKEDEMKMDEYEDVPESYTKETAMVELWARKQGQEGAIDITKRCRRVRVVFHADRKHTVDTKQLSAGAYSYKINQGILDAVEEGIPQGYIDECLRPFVPDVDDAGMKTAIQDAIMMGVDVKRLVEKAENDLAKTGVKQEREVIASKQSFTKYLQSMMPATKGTKEYQELARRRALSSAW